MILRVSSQIWRKMAEFLLTVKSAFSLPQSYENVDLVTGGTSIDRLKRIPSLFRGLASFGAAPVLLPARQMAQQHRFPKNLPLSVIHAGQRPKRTDHV